MKTLACLLASFLAATSIMADAPNQDTKAQSSLKNTAPNPIYGAEIFSHESVLFGRFTLRMKMVSHSGVVSSFFTYDNQSWQGNGIGWREIDIEALGRNENTLQTNLITGEASHRLHAEQKSLIPDLNDYHTYVVEWTPDNIVWTVDGKEIRRDSAVHSSQVRDLTDTPQTYRANIWVSEVIQWVGAFDETSLPLYQVIDWIQYETLEADGSFKVAWKDDFNSINAQRWGLANWGFESNLATFSPKNAEAINGELVLALTAGERGIDKEHYLANR